MVVSPYFGEKSHVSNGQNVSFKEPCLQIGICIKSTSSGPQTSGAKQASGTGAPRLRAFPQHSPGLETPGQLATLTRCVSLACSSCVRRASCFEVRLGRLHGLLEGLHHVRQLHVLGWLMNPVIQGSGIHKCAASCFQVHSSTAPNPR